VSGDAISSTKFNSLVQDLESDANVDRPIAAGGTGASTASAARTNLGLAIGTDVQAFDAGLLSIAGLTTLADRSIYTTASDTYAVYTLTAAGRAILDDADASAQRTTLGLGNLSTVTASAFALTILDDADAAAVRTTIGAGTGNGNGDMLKSENLSGLANYSTARSNMGLAIGTNVQAYDAGLQSIAGLTTAADTLIYTTAFDTYATATLTSFGRSLIDDANQAAGQATLGYTAADVLAKLLTVDGAGSNLDADTLDGDQGSAFAKLASPDFSGTPTISSAAIVSVSATQTLTNKTLTSPTINGGTSSTRVIASSETTGTLTVASANETIQATGDITIPNAVFAAGDIILIYAGASARTITQGASVTMRLGGTATTGSRTLAARGVAVLFFVSSSEVVVSGGAVT